MGLLLTTLPVKVKGPTNWPTAADGFTSALLLGFCAQRVGLVFELPVLIFFLTLLRVVNPQFLLNHSRYAILIIFILAAVITPTPDAFNMMLFATPMCLLFFVGIFASYLLVLNREGRRFPWSRVLIPVLLVLILISGGLILAITKFGLHLVPRWPFLMR